MRPTSPRSETTACWRSASICLCAVSVIREASDAACSRISAMICAPWALASSRMREASERASTSCAWYCSSAAWACAWASSALFIPPSIAAVRSA